MKDQPAKVNAAGGSAPESRPEREAAGGSPVLARVTPLSPPPAEPRMALVDDEAVRAPSPTRLTAVPAGAAVTPRLGSATPAPGAAPAAPSPVPPPPSPLSKAVESPAARPGATVAAPAATPTVPHSVAGMARVRARHVGILASFITLCVLPALLVAWYLFAVAKDQYTSMVGFSVQREDGAGTLDILGGLTQLTGPSTPDPMILYKYITSRDMIHAVEKTVDLRAAFTAEGDPWYSLPENASIEDREEHWERMVNVFLDSSSGLIEIRVRTFDPASAQAIAQAITQESARLLNQLAETAKADSTRFAKTELDAATERLREARAATADFRIRNQIVDPETDFAGRMGLLNSLVAQLAAAQIEREVMAGGSSLEDDPRIQQIDRRIEVISRQIEEERARISTDTTEGGTAFAALVSEYENLKLQETFAQQAYVTALANMDMALQAAQRTSRYLAIYKPPTLAETAEYPERMTWTLVIGGMILVLWSIAVLTYYAVRDRR